jgi:hypothetical protein
VTFEQFLQAGRRRADLDLVLVENELAKLYLEAMKDTQEQIKDFLAKGYAPEEMRRYARLANLYSGIKEEYVRISKDALTTTDLASADAFVESYKTLEWAVDGSKGVISSFGMPPLEVVRASVMSDHSGLTVKEIYGKNVNAELSKIQGTITRGLLQGKGYAKVAKELENDFTGGFNNALRVVRTENTRNWTEGRLASIDRGNELGLKFKHKWMASLDRRTREAHGRLDGQYADKDGYFHMDGVKYRGPGFSDGGPETVINCRCDSIQELANEPPETMRRYDGDIREYQDYVTWATAKGWTKESGWPKVAKV